MSSGIKRHGMIHRQRPISVGGSLGEWMGMRSGARMPGLGTGYLSGDRVEGLEKFVLNKYIGWY